MKKTFYTLFAGIGLIITSCGGAKTTENTDNQAPAPAPEMYQLNEGTTITWNAKHTTDTSWAHIGTVAAAGELTLEGSAVTAGKIVFDINTIAENEETAMHYGEYAPKLLAHLKDSGFFLLSANFETSFTITSCTEKEISGKLSILGVEQDVTIPAEVVVANGEITAKGEVMVDFSKFGMTGVPDPATLTEEQKKQSVANNVLIQLDVKASKPEAH